MRWGPRDTGGPFVPRMGLGALTLRGTGDPAEQAAAARLLRHALDAGVRLFDAADAADRRADGPGQRLLGDAVADCRDEVLLTLPQATGRGGAAGSGAAAAGGGPVEECERALRRLGTDRIDVYYLDTDPAADPAGRPLAERVGEVAALVAAGKVRGLGLAGPDVAGRLAAVHAQHPVAAVAVEYSLLCRDAERTVLPAARALGVPVVAGRPLAGGILTGRIGSPVQLRPDDPRRRDPRFAAAALAAELPRLKELEEIAAGLNLGAGRLALAWLLTRGTDVLPVVGSLDPVHLEMDLSAARVVLPQDAVDRLGAIFPAA